MRFSKVFPLLTALSLVPFAARADSPSNKPEKKQEEGTDWLLWSGLGMVGVGGVFLSLGVYESLTIKDAGGDFVNDPTFVAYQKRIPSSVSDVCAGARGGATGSPPASASELAAVVRLCDSPTTEANHKRNLGYAFYGVGVLSVAIGATLILMRPPKSPSEGPNKEEKSASVRFEPVVTPSGGGLLVIGRF
jgi:hypothetical protein